MGLGWRIKTHQRAKNGLAGPLVRLSWLAMACESLPMPIFGTCWRSVWIGYGKAWARLALSVWIGDGLAYGKANAYRLLGWLASLAAWAGYLVNI